MRKYRYTSDGDELNIFSSRSIQTSVELSNLMAIPLNIVSPQSNRPVVGPIQDTVLGCKLLTGKNTRLTKEQVNILMSRSGVPFDTSKEIWTGREVFSLFLPKDLNYQSGDILIKNGQLIEGQLNKKSIGIASNSLIHIIWLDYGPEVTKDFINNVSCVINYWLMSMGFSAGLSDTIADPKTAGDINKNIDLALMNINDTINNIEHNEQNNAMDIENKILNELNGIRDKTGSMAINSVFNNNNIKDMVTAGSKGSALNIAQIMSAVGQQSVKNNDGAGRVINGFMNRTLPHTEKYDISPEARGFIRNSYFSGLNPKEYFFHSMAGRDGF
jgi:DNA-directed RNA polymerase II subunit RPB1